MLGCQRRLLGLIFLRHFLGVAASGLGLFELFVLDSDELRAKRLDLLLHCRPHIGGGDDGTKAARGGDGLEAGNANPHDEHLCRRHCSGGCHHHRQCPVIFAGTVDHRLVAGKVRLRRQHVHHLGTGDARHEFHGKGCHASLSEGGDPGIVAVGVHDGDDGGALFVGLEFGLDWTTNLQNHVSLGDVGGLADGGTCLGEISVWDARGVSGSRFDDNIKTQAGYAFYRIGRRSNAPLVRINLARYEYDLSHRMILSAGTQFPTERRPSGRCRPTQDGKVLSENKAADRQDDHEQHRA